MGAIDTLIANVDGIILGFVQGSFGSLTTTIQIMWQLMFVVFIAIYGYKVMISGRFSASDLLMHSVKIIILLTLATEWGTFFTFVYQMVTDLPSDIAGQIMQGAASSMGQNAQANTQVSANTALSAFFDRGMQVMQTLLQGAGWTDVGLYFYAGAVGFGTIALVGYAGMLIILAKIAVAILLAVGPIFILLLIFSHTKGLFEGWLRTLLNYAVIPIFVYTLLAFLLTIDEQPLKNLEVNSSVQSALITAVGPFVLTSLISMLLLMQVMNIAASITGALSLSSMGGYGWGVRTISGAGIRASAWSWNKMTKSSQDDGKVLANKTARSQFSLRQSLEKSREVQ